MKLNIGSGGRKLAGWVNIDSQPMENPDVVLDVSTETWPWPDNSVDEAYASHVLEHIAPGAPFFHTLRELYRVCKNGAPVKIVLPHPSHDIFLQDPTHLQAVLPGTMVMFSKRYVEGAAAEGKMYTPFYKYLGVDFNISSIGYSLDPTVDKSDPELEWKMGHLRNIIFEWNTTLVVVK